MQNYKNNTTFAKNTAHNEVAFSYRTTAEGEVGK